MSLRYGTALVEIFDSSAAAAQAAAGWAAHLLCDVIRERGGARILTATGNSQLAFVQELAQHGEVDWRRVHALHMDEYAGLRADHPASFRRWIRTNLAERLPLASVAYLAGDAPDLDAEIMRYSELLHAAPVDVAFVGFGENGHVAFNDPPAANFDDPATVKQVDLDSACRRQQVGEGHFPDLEAVPARALTVTCPGLFQAAHWVCMVPERRKAKAVQSALEGPIAESCPASLVRRHPSARVFLDRDSASLLRDR